MNLRNRILLLCIGLLLVILLLVLGLVQRSTYQHTRTQISEQLRFAHGVLVNELHGRQQAQSAMAELIAKDFTLLGEIADLIASPEQQAQSLSAALESFSARSQASFALVSAPDGRILAGTDGLLQAGQRLPWHELLVQDEPVSQERLVLLGGQVLHVNLTPIFAPRPNLLGWLVMAFTLDDEAARHLGELSGAQVALLAGPPGAYLVPASNLPASARAELAGLQLGEASEQLLELQGEQQVIYRAPVAGTGGELQLLLLRSLSGALASYQPLRWQLVAITALALLLAVIGAWLLASTVSRPLRQMVDSVRRIAAGDYQARVSAGGGAEISLLASEFNHMQQDIAEREATISFLAYRDPLTGLDNRNRFVDRLQDALAAATPGTGVAVLLMDLDNFKDLNDTLGHEAGDQLLRLLGERLQQHLREHDRLARLGGDEFALLVAPATPQQALAAAHHYHQLLAQPFAVRGISMLLNATLGIALSPDHGESAGALLQHAEVAMYWGKAQHLSQAMYRAELDSHSLLRLALMSELKGAIEGGQLALYFQPKLLIRQRRLLGVECLVRWIHPQHGFVAPDDFIPLAEQTGNVCALTRWVLRTALAQNRAWHDQGLPLKTAVNISALDLADPGFADFITDALAEYQVVPETLVVEITESAVMADPGLAMQQLDSLRRLGVRLSIDDYGTGYSSMAQLKRLPVHELKIDKSFIQDLPGNPDDEIIVRSTIELGHNMGLQVVAEGVESLEILEQLDRLGCDIAQGYLLSKPLPAAAFAAWLEGCPWQLPRVE
ncbi:diguanylate cyclase (GGDEF)-like protein [Pseudomonas fluvialis]|uniref:Diguanylate cyclase (GGDEF)-like protein n=1 Tax=Pseudomonas fluvialis TaxID=1793966 RepID=A0A7X0BPB2_9PSED|nr:EAL domain-containing protein [Pseudomonas fluvialis]MBB6340344.1 diguanylate cyclase (GGDEF)-like protein [Pseudomonas fluvialis]